MALSERHIAELRPKSRYDEVFDTLEGIVTVGHQAIRVSRD